jgi:hypothetical protein
MLVCNLPTNALLVEVLQAAIYNEISVAQWLGLTPKQIVKDHLGLSEDTLDRLDVLESWGVDIDYSRASVLVMRVA